MVGLRAAIAAGPQEGEVMKVDLEAVSAPQEFVEGSEFGVGDLDGDAAHFTDQMLVIVFQSDVPSPGLTVPQWSVVDKPDPGKIFKHPIHGGSLYAPGAFHYIIDNHARADESLFTVHHRADHRAPGKGQAQSGFPYSIDQQVFGQNVIIGHSLGK
jgi:hypothetical protein